VTVPKLQLVPLLGPILPGDRREIRLGNGFSIRWIKGLLRAQDFEVHRSRLSDWELNEFLAWDGCLVREFSSAYRIGAEHKRSDVLCHLVVASFRWLHPTETTAEWYVCGSIENEVFGLDRFARRQNIEVILEDCEAVAGLISADRFREARAFLTDFERIADSIEKRTYEFNPVVTALRLSEQAYIDRDPQIRFLKRVMALEALFSSGASYGRKALLPRVPLFIDGNTPIYRATAAPYTVTTVLPDLCDLRNAFAHGNNAPTALLDQPSDGSIASEHVKSYADVLREASAVILRQVFLRIFRERLVDVFADKSKMETFVK
jgi:hypothetical protein